MNVHQTAQMLRYSRIAIFLHWAIAALLMFQISLGWGMGRTFGLVQLHKSIGIAILLLSLIRLGVRFVKPRPPATEGGITGALARIVHVGLYVFMIATPISGWVIVSTSKLNIPTLLFGTVPWPHLPVPQTLHDSAEAAHSALVWMGLALFLLHVAGAIRHHALLRDGLIYRMTPVRSAPVMWALLALIPLGLFGAKALTGFGPPAPPMEKAAPVAEENAAEAVDAASSVGAGNAVAPIGNAVENTAAPVADIPVPRWTVLAGGTLNFSVGYGEAPATGGFSRWSANIAMDPDRPETADIRVEVDLASVTMGDPTQQEMVGGDDFLGVSTHPKAVFQASGAAAAGKGVYRASGTLTLKGIKGPQSVRFVLTGAGKRRHVTGTAAIKRSAFGVGVGDNAAGLDPNVAVQFAFDAEMK